MKTCKTFVINGEKYSLSSFTVEVLNTEAHSNTHVYGSGFVVGDSNSITGASAIRSSVSTTRTIWFRREDGGEGHWQANFDLPVREGNHLTFYSLTGPRTAIYAGCDKKGRDLFKPIEYVTLGVKVQETGQYYPAGGYDSQGQLYAVDPEKFYESSWRLLIFGLVATLFYGVGLIILTWLALRMLLLMTGTKRYGIPERLANERLMQVRAAITENLSELIRKKYLPHPPTDSSHSI